MSIDYSLYGGAETPFPPSPLPTPALSNDFTSSSSSSSSEGEGEGEDTPLPRPHQTSKSQDYFTLRKRPSNSKDDGDNALAGGIGMEKIPRVASPNVKDPEDFLWIMTEEPHRSRRKAILKAHPEVRKLMGHTPYTFPLVLLVLSLQLLTAFSLSTTHPFSLKFLALAYALGGTANQNIFLAIHEITHNLAFKRILPNKWLAMLANVAIGVPYAMAFKGYHIEHHKYLGEDGIDTDLPSKLEAIVLNNVAGKTFFATFQIFFYALRPGFIRSQKPTLYHLLNLIVILSADYLIVHFGSWNSLLYLLFSSFFAGSLHPCAGHFIAEHYLMNEVASKQEGEDPVGKEGEMDLIRSLSQETTSYYGPLNLLCYNVGYHNEHHDFPSIPWTRLPKLREIAKEFYDPLPVHSSWCKVTWKFICDERVGMWSRAKRVAGDKGERIEEEDWKVCLKADEKAVNSMQKKQVKLVQDDVKVVGVEVDVNAEEDVELEKMMDEAVERGYGSDKEEKRTGRSGRARK